LLDGPEIALRLGVATLAGGLIGLNRDLHGKPIGLKTLGLVGLATAMVVMLADSFGDSTKLSDAASRIIQGILTGIGFLGAGVIVHPEHHFRVRGAHQRRLHLARGVRRHRLRRWAMANRRGRHGDRIHAPDRRPPARALAASLIRRQGRAGARTRCRCFPGGYAFDLIVAANRQLPVRTSPANRPRPCSSPKPALFRGTFRNWLPRSCATTFGAENLPTGIR
jgi:hypothetical protein